MQTAIYFQMSFVTNISAADTQPLVELVLEARAEVTVNVTDVDSVVIVLLSSTCCISRGIKCTISSKNK